VDRTPCVVLLRSTGKVVVLYGSTLEIAAARARAEVEGKPLP
jgi:hypothetical protein